MLECHMDSCWVLSGCMLYHTVKESIVHPTAHTTKEGRAVARSEEEPERDGGIRDPPYHQ